MSTATTTEPGVDLMLERSVLSVILDGRHAQAWPVFAERCNALSFFARDHRLIALVCAWLAEDGERIDSSTVTSRAQVTRYGDAVQALAELEGERRKVKPGRDEATSYDDSLLAGLGGFNGVVSEIGQHFAAPTAHLRNCLLLSALHRQRDLCRLLASLLDEARAVNGSQRLADIGARALAELPALTTASVKAGTLHEAGSEVMAHYDAVSAQCLERVGSWGIRWLDETLPLAAGRIVVLAAAPGAGKTSLMLQAAQATSIAMGPASVAIVSIEMSRDQLARTLIAREVGCTMTAIEKGFLTPEQRSAADVVLARWQTDSLWMRDGADRCTADQIAAWVRARQQASGNRLHLVLIDYLQIIDARHPNERDYEMLTYASKTLRRLASSTGLCIVELSQMSNDALRAGRDKRGRLQETPEPQLTDLKGSGSISADATGVVFLWRADMAEEGPEVLTHCKVAKNRFGKTGRTTLTFQRARGQRFIGETDRAEPERRPNATMHTEPTATEGAVWNS